jgi:hypothetical protein
MSESRPIATQSVWVFVGDGKGVGGVFSQLATAKQWIESRALSGILTEYPLDIGAYEWAIQTHAFTPTRPEHSLSRFIGSFVSATMRHHHFENGKMLA